MGHKWASLLMMKIGYKAYRNYFFFRLKLPFEQINAKRRWEETFCCLFLSLYFAPSHSFVCSRFFFFTFCFVWWMNPQMMPGILTCVLLSSIAVNAQSIRKLRCRQINRLTDTSHTDRDIWHTPNRQCLPFFFSCFCLFFLLSFSFMSHSLWSTKELFTYHLIAIITFESVRLLWHGNRNTDELSSFSNEDNLLRIHFFTSTSSTPSPPLAFYRPFSCVQCAFESVANVFA